ncbi:VOC family protein [bacterium]|nr:VOC family protein [bacterium]
MNNAINWFEIPVKDMNRAAAFYEKILGASLHRDNIMGFDMAFLPCDQGSVGGALVSGEGYVPSDKGALVYLNGGNDLSQVLNRVVSAGGTVIVPKTNITPEIGFFAIFKDVEGNKVALHSME